MSGRSSARSLFQLCFWAVLPLWWSPLAWWLAYSPQPAFGIIEYLELITDFMLIGMVFLALLVLFITPPALLFRRARRSALLYGACSLLFISSYIVGECYLSRSVWRHAVSRFERGSAPLVQAIEAYQKEKGRPPSSLEDLVPSYLKEVPSTGFATSPKYRYIEGEKAREYSENPWVLVVSPPCHVMGFDLLLYFPRQNYPTIGYGGWLERFGAWAYVHE